MLSRWASRWPRRCAPARRVVGAEAFDEVDALLDALGQIARGESRGRYTQDRASGEYSPLGWFPDPAAHSPCRARATPPVEPRAFHAGIVLSGAAQLARGSAIGIQPGAGADILAWIS